MKRLNDSGYSQAGRMMEFYDRSELEWYLEGISALDLDLKDSLTYLDMQTRVNYVSGVVPDPKIHEYFLDYIKPRMVPRLCVYTANTFKYYSIYWIVC